MNPPSMQQPKQTPRLSHSKPTPLPCPPLKPPKVGLIAVCVCPSPTCVVELLFEQQQSHVLPVTIMHNALGLGDVKHKPAGSSTKAAVPIVQYTHKSLTKQSDLFGVLTNTTPCFPQQWLATAAVTAVWMTNTQTHVIHGLAIFCPQKAVAVCDRFQACLADGVAERGACGPLCLVLKIKP